MLVIVSLAAQLTVFQIVSSAPIMFKFEATVGPRNAVSPFDVPFDLPFQFQEGDTILGSIAVNERDVAPDVLSTSKIEALNASFEIDGFTLGTSQYSIDSRDDLFVSEGGVVPYDEITVGCSPFAGSLAVCTPNYIDDGDGDEALWGFCLGLAGQPDVLAGADIHGDVTIWNSFRLGRGISMTFREANGFGIMRLVASVGSFTEVPEPRGLTLVSLGLIVGGLFQLSFRRVR
jgi:hypothetical protein